MCELASVGVAHTVSGNLTPLILKTAPSMLLILERPRADS